ncbi:MAG: GNAT family N-acetyltransferase [bacterium]|nr:GNAT family N-acetyltransferase [bacterium]
MKQLREATTADIPAMLGLLEQLFEIEQDFEFVESVQQLGLEELLASKALVLVAELAGEVVAMAQMQELVSTASGGKVGLIEDVIVDQAHRDQGLGEDLIEALTEAAQERGYARLQLLADKDNYRALKFYGRLGWFATNLIPLRFEP